MFHCRHVYREANCTVDLLAKWSYKHDIIQQFYTIQKLVGVIRGSYNLEKMEVHNLRRRKLRCIKQSP